MRLQEVGVSIVGTVAIVSAVLAAATVWLFLTDPITVADAVNQGEITPFIRDLANVLLTALRNLFGYL